MDNQDYFLQKLKVFLKYWMEGTIEPGIRVWGIECDADLYNSKLSGNYCFEIDKTDLPWIYEQCAIETNSTVETWKDHFENGAKLHNVDINSVPLYLHLVVYGKGNF